MIPLHTPTRIGSTEVVLVDDLVISHIAPNLEQQLIPISSPDSDLPIYVERRQVEMLSEQHPSLPLYGVWQVMLASKRVPSNAGLYQVLTDHPSHPIRYLVREEDGAYSGWVTEDNLLDPAIGQKNSPEPVMLKSDMTDLHLPTQPIQTTCQQHAEQRQAWRQSLIFLGFILLAGAFAGVAADRVLHHRHTAHLEQAAILQDQVTALQDILRQLNQQGRIEAIDQTRQLEHLILLARHTQSVEVPQRSLLSDTPMHAIIRAPRAPETPPGLPIHSATHQADASLHVRW